MDPEGSGDSPDTDFLIQNRTGTVQHATVRCQTSTSTVFSKMVELASGETVTYDDLPAELIQFQASVADGPKGSNMYDMTSVSGTVVAGISGADVVFETTTEPVESASEIADVFDDGGVESAEASFQTTDDSEDTGDNTSEETNRHPSGTDTSGGSTADTSEATRSVDDTNDPGRDESGTTGSDRPDRQTGDTSVAPSADSDGSSGPSSEVFTTEVNGATGPDMPEGVEYQTADAGTSAGGSQRTSDRSPDGTSTVGPETDASGKGGTEFTGSTPSEPSADDNPERTLGSNEVHCRNCGSIIRSNAEICPECGVQNAARAVQQTDRTDDTDRADPPGSGAGSTEQPVVNDPDREPGSDESYCRNCGEIVRDRAEICPECGVRNVAHTDHSSRQAARSQPIQREAGSTATQPRPTGRTADTSGSGGQQTGSEPSGSWVNGVRLGALLWFLVLLILVPTILRYQSAIGGSGVGLSSMLQSLGLAALLPPIQLLAWVVLPVSLYFDLKYVDYHVDEWPLSGRLYLVSAAILPILTQVLGAAALFANSRGVLLAGVIPVTLLALSVRHLRIRSRLV